jgi:tRNA (guanine-N7-)-methyltransferase
MGGRKDKKKKIAELNTFSNVLQCFDFKHPVLYDCKNKAIDTKGRWSEVFGNDCPVVVELACGKGEYTLALAQKFPNKNFVGVDIKGSRMHTGAKHCIELGIVNVRFARFKIENIPYFFGEREIEQIWITFPDPFPKGRHEKHRLTHPKFLEKYRPLMAANGIVHLKTDDEQLFSYSVESIEKVGAKLLYCKEDIYSEPLDFPELEIKTFYERQHLATGRKIHFLRFCFE